MGEHADGSTPTSRLEEGIEDRVAANEDLASSKSVDDLIATLADRHVLQLTPEEDQLLDPIERTVRYIIPIPKHYYWEILHDRKDWLRIPVLIRAWHNTIGYLEHVGTWTNTSVAQPIASFLGLTGPRFHEVINSMTAEEMQQSAHTVRDRRERDAQRRVLSQNMDFSDRTK
jgi:hypothetical protein